MFQISPQAAWNVLLYVLIIIQRVGTTMANQEVTPPLNDESMEKKMVSLAMKQAENQLKKGTASSQIVTHFLKLGSIRAQIELEQLQLQNRLLEEKIESERAGQQIQEQIAEVINALRRYSPPPQDDSYDDVF